MHCYKTAGVHIKFAFALKKTRASSQNVSKVSFRIKVGIQRAFLFYKLTRTCSWSAIARGVILGYHDHNDVRILDCNTLIV